MFLPRPCCLRRGGAPAGPAHRRSAEAGSYASSARRRLIISMGALGAVRPLLPRLGAGALNGLFDGVGGEDAEEHRYAGLQRRLGDALGHLRAHIVVVGWWSPGSPPPGR